MSDDDFGECVINWVESRARFRIDRADPRIRIAGPLMRDGLGTTSGWHFSGVQLCDDRLVINGMNQKVIYRIGAYHEDYDWYEAERAD